MSSFIPDILGKARDFQPATFHGEAGELISTLVADRGERPCTTHVAVKFRFKSEHHNVKAGEADLHLIDRKYRHPVRPDKTWADHLLHVPEDYDPEELHLHPAADDALDDITKTLLAVYDIKGNPKVPQALLEDDDIALITEFRLNKDFRGGKGFAQIAMQSLFHGMAELGFVGTYILSPAPLDFVVSCPMSEVECNNHWQEAVDGLIRSYKKSGYEVWKRGDEDKQWTISIMGLSWPPAEDEFEDDDEPEHSLIPTQPGTVLQLPYLEPLPLCPAALSMITKIDRTERIQHWLTTSSTIVIEYPPQQTSCSSTKWPTTFIRRLAGLRLPETERQRAQRQATPPPQEEHESSDGFLSPTQRPRKRIREDFR